MDLYFNTKTHKLHILESEDVYSWEEPFCEELVQDFDIDNIKSAYNILYIEGDEPYKTTIKCVENIDTFKHECNKFLEWYNYRSGEDYVLNNSNLEYSEENNSTKFKFDGYHISTIIYFENLEIENNCFLK